MVPSDAMTRPRMPVSSSTSRTAASSAGSPAPTRPLGRARAPDAGPLLAPAHGGVLGGLPGLDVALGQRPQQAPPTVPAADQGHLRTLAAAVDDQAACRGLLHLAQPGARTRPPATAAARAAVVAVPWGGRWGHLAMVARPRYVGRGPCRGLARRTLASR